MHSFCSLLILRVHTGVMLRPKSLLKSSVHQMTLVSDSASHAAIIAAPVILPLTVSSINGPCLARPERLPAAADSPPSTPSAPSPFSAVGPMPLPPLAPLAPLPSVFFVYQLKGYHRYYHQSSVSHLMTLDKPFK